MPATPDVPDETMIAYVRGRLPADQAERLGSRPRRPAPEPRRRDRAGARDRRRRRRGGRASPAPGELGWARLSRALDAEAARRRRAGRSGSSRRRPRRRSWSGRWSAVPLLTGPAASPATRRCRSSPPPASALSVAFAPDATEAAIRGAAAGDRRPDQRRAERHRPLAAQLRQRRGARRRPRPASRPTAIVESAQSARFRRERRLGASPDPERGRGSASAAAWRAGCGS